MSIQSSLHNLYSVFASTVHGLGVNLRYGTVASRYVGGLQFCFLVTTVEFNQDFWSFKNFSVSVGNVRVFESC